MVGTEAQASLFPDLQEWSYSRLKSIRRCALEYKLRYIDHLEGAEPSGRDVARGRLLHSVVRRYYADQDRTYAGLRRILDEAAPRTNTWKSAPDGEMLVLQMLQGFAASDVAALVPVQTEIECRTAMAGVSISGRADLLYRTPVNAGELGLLEFKLTESELGSADPAQRFLQTIIYWLGLPYHLKRDTTELRYYVFETGKSGVELVNEALVSRAVQLVSDAIVRAGGDAFEPTVNPFCSSCGFRKRCPAVVSAVG